MSEKDTIESQAEESAVSADSPESISGESGAGDSAGISDDKAADEIGAEHGAEGDGEAESGEQSEEPNWKDMYARMLADFDNYRKRVSRDREELVKFAASETVKDMLVTADNLGLALAQAKDQEDSFVKGVKLAYDSFLKALKDHGAEPFDSVGMELDPNRHEAIATLPSADFAEGLISTEVKKGWMLNGRLLRAAQVVVSSGPAQ